MAVAPVAAAAFLAAYVLLQVGVGLWFARKVRSEDDYFVAGRNLALVPAAISLFATWFGAETLMGSSAAIAKGGMAGARAEPIGFALCLFAMGLLVAAAFRARGYVTLADFFKQRFDWRSECLSSVAVVLGSVVWAAAQLLALAEILHTVLQVPVWITLIASCVLVITYTAVSGLLGNVATGVVQGAILLIGLVLLLVAVAGRFGGFESMLGSIEPRQLNLLEHNGSVLERIDSWFIPILGGIVTQEALSRLLATRSPAQARLACFGASGLYLLVGAIPVILALAGMHLAPAGWEGDNFLPALALASLPPLAFLVFVAALMSAILSTVSANILAIASVTSVNLLGRLHARASPRLRLVVARGATVGAGVAALAVAGSGSSIYQLILLSVVMGQGGILVAVVFGLYSRVGGAASGFAAILACMATNAATLLIYPFVRLTWGGGGTPPVSAAKALAAIGASKAPTVHGYFLLSILAAIGAYLATAWLSDRGSARSPRLEPAE